VPRYFVVLQHAAADISTVFFFLVDHPVLLKKIPACNTFRYKLEWAISMMSSWFIKKVIKLYPQKVDGQKISILSKEITL